MLIRALRRSFLASGPSLSRRPLTRFALRAMSSDERTKADTAAASGAAATVGETIFDKIINGQIPAKIAYEDEQCLAFHDVSPQAPVHILLIPKKRDGLTQLAHAEERHEAVLGHLLYAAKLVAKQQNLDKGFRIVINDGEDGCQSVFHLHLHLLGGRKLGWPPG
ncbi:Histidine triad nucleotide-binding protein 2, mitochondrial [Phytophthora pseudosyringae]|uniref:Histidine triad nucleotide-binding protein 2, mitochondrial n=1 Tax=Phytophthora pseudosyringae TaxID=221518 RepID=A0A8T1WJW2_9STRA|nr:Histidine triad nucleotide-binding protein 2, mitochondrial [Phytophthora pseudosyringae]